MTSTFERSRPQPHPKALARSIREVCLIGSRARRYIHLVPALEGLGAQDSGPSGERKVRTG